MHCDFSKYLKLAKPIILSALMLPALSGCITDEQVIGHPYNAASQIKGAIPEEYILEVSNDIKQIVYVEASQLIPGGHYYFSDGSICLAIRGDIPEHTSIEVNGAQLLIIGSVRAYASIKVNVPEKTHQVEESKGSFTTVEDGPLEPYDQDPTILIEGNVDETAKLSTSTNAKIQVRGFYAEKYK